MYFGEQFRATVTNRDNARVKRAILPAATDEFHHNGSFPFLGDKDAGLEKWLSITESGL